MYLLALDCSTKATGCAIFKDKELMASTVITASSMFADQINIYS